MKRLAITFIVLLTLSLFSCAQAGKNIPITETSEKRMKQLATELFPRNFSLKKEIPIERPEIIKTKWGYLFTLQYKERPKKDSKVKKDSVFTDIFFNGLFDIGSTKKISEPFNIILEVWNYSLSPKKIKTCYQWVAFFERAGKCSRIQFKILAKDYSRRVLNEKSTILIEKETETLKPKLKKILKLMLKKERDESQKKKKGSPVSRKPKFKI